jgi:transcriptional regulator with XRE-family HTH domain
MNATVVSPAGALLREWRVRRHLSQLDLALEAEISTRHLSFVETGRSRPSRDLLLHLAELLEMPLRERNALLMSAGFAPRFQERALDAPELAAARAALELILSGHEPYPALAVDRHWNLVLSNAAARRLLVGVSAQLLKPPINVLRISLHPEGLASGIVNLEEIRGHLLHRLRRQVASSGDAVLAELLRELSALPGGAVGGADPFEHLAGVVVPLRFRTALGELALFSTISVFGTPTDITLSELALESFFPADAQSAGILRQMATADVSSASA